MPSGVGSNIHDGKVGSTEYPARQQAIREGGLADGLNGKETEYPHQNIYGLCNEISERRQSFHAMGSAHSPLAVEARSSLDIQSIRVLNNYVSQEYNIIVITVQ